jgi:LysM repeat protein
VLIVIILTVMAAVYMTIQDVPPEVTATPIVLVSPPPVTITPVPLPLTATPTPVQFPTGTLALISPTTPAMTLEPTVTPVPPTATDTPTTVIVPPTATATSTPIVVVITATPTPIKEPPPSAGGGICQPPPTWVSYTVQTGDTLNSLADRTNLSVFDLQQVNCLESFTIFPGDIVYLPFTPPTATPSPTRAPTGTRRPTPTRTATPINPRIVSVVARLTPTEIVVVVQGENFRSRERGFRAELVGPTTIPLQLGEARTSTSFEAFAPVPLDLPYQPTCRGAPMIWLS